MRTAPIQHHGLSFLPHLFAGSDRVEGAARLSGRHCAALALVLIPTAALPIYFSWSGQPDTLWDEHLAHALLEGFCALMSLVVFYILHQEYVLTGTRQLRAMSYGFLVLGILDMVHAFSPPGSNLFVWLRVTAAFSGALFLASSLLPSMARKDREPVAPREAWQHATAVAVTALAFGAASYPLQPWLPRMASSHGFSLFAFILTGSAGLSYVLVGVFFIRQFRRNRETILFVLALAMFLFAESQFLFTFSRLWDLIWWAWHWIRTAVFLGILMGLAYEFAQSVRDLEASQASLIEVEKLASLGEMAAAVAHEIRNPLGAITSSLGLLKDAPVSDAERRELFEILEREVNRLNHIVSDTLTFAHPRVAPRQPVALAPLVEEMLQRSVVQHREVRTIVMFDPDLPPVLGDVYQLQRMFWNIVDNALAAMDFRGELQIQAARADGQIVLTVSDSGRGIAEELQANLFKPFFSTKPQGTGLGLSIVQRIVNDHGGRIRLDSRTGAGTRVTVELPAAQSPAVELRQREAIVAP